MENREQKGQVLKQARQSKGLSLEAVHATTKIPMDILRALEEGYTVRTLTPFYYRGFVKIYAQYLGLELSAILTDFHPEKIPEPVKLSNRPSIFELQARLMQKQATIKFIGKVVLIVLALLLAFKVIGFVAHKIKDRKPAVARITHTQIAQEKFPKVGKEATAPKAILRPPVEESIPQSVATPVTGPITALVGKEIPAFSKNINLTVRAKKNSWLRVKADRLVVFQSTLNKGGVETWIADDAIEISGRNINQLEFELNGKLLGPLGREGRAVKNVLFTKDGLSVQK